MTDGLSQMKISAIIQDSVGNIWVGTRNGLNKINGSGITPFFQEDGLPSNRILDLICLSKREIIILTSKGLSFYDGKNFSTYEYLFPEVENRLLPYVNGKLLILSYSGLTVFDGSSFIHKEIPVSVYNHYLSETGILYTRSGQEDFMQIDTNLQVIESQKIASSYTEYLLPSSYYYTECVDTHCKELIFKSPLTHKEILSINSSEIQGKDLSRFSYLIHPTGIIFISSSESHPFPTELINPSKVFFDKQGQLWLGGENGLEVFAKTPFTHIKSTEEKNIWAINEKANGEILMASYGQGLFAYQEGSLRPLIKRGLFFPSTTKGKSGSIYFSNVHQLTEVQEGITSYYYHPALAVAYDHKRDRLISSGYGKVIFHPSKGKRDSITLEDGLHEHYYIQDIAVDSTGNYWFSSYTGVSLYQPTTQQIINFTSPQSNLPAGPGVFSVFVDRENTVWLGGESGLMYFREGVLEKVTGNVLSKQIKGITTLRPDILLLATPQELISFDKKKYFQDQTVAVQYFNQWNGYRGIEPGFSPFFRAANGEIFISSSSSVDIINPKHLDKLSSRPKANLYQINHKPLPFIHKDSSFSIQNSNSIILHAESIGSFGPNIPLFNFKMDDQEWTGWQEQAFYNFNQVPHGRHLFQCAVGPYGSLPDSALDRVYIHINLPFYRRSNFLYFFSGLMAFLSGLILYLWLKENRNRRRYRMQRIESSYLKTHLLLSQMSPHFIFNALSSIQHKVLFGKREDANKQLVQLSALIRNFLEASYKSNDPNKIVESEISLRKEIELLDSYLALEKVNNNHHFSYSIEVEEAISTELEMLPPMLLQPFVENAVKHGVLPCGRGGSIHINFYSVDESLTCRIKDNGRGFVHDTTNEKKGVKSSYGLKITQERIQLLNQLGYNIKVEIESAINQGTEITLSINNS